MSDEDRPIDDEARPSKKRLRLFYALNDERGETTLVNVSKVKMVKIDKNKRLSAVMGPQLSLEISGDTAKHFLRCWLDDEEVADKIFANHEEALAKKKVKQQDVI